MLRFRFCLGCRWCNSSSRDLDKQKDGVVGYASIISSYFSFFFPHPCSSSRLWVMWPSPTPSFESCTYWYCSPRCGRFGRGCTMQSTFMLFTSLSQSCMVEFEGTGVIFESACASPIIIFALGRLKSSHPSPSPLRLSYFQIPSAYNHRTLRIDRPSGLEISCLFCALVYAFHSHLHTKQLCISQPLVDSIPRFSGLSAAWA
jgi:hypothetical protein